MNPCKPREMRNPAYAGSDDFLFLHFESFQEKWDSHQHLRGRLSREGFHRRALSNMLGRLAHSAGTGSVGVKNQGHM